MNKQNVLSKAEMKKVMGGTTDPIWCYANHGSGQECIWCCSMNFSDNMANCETACNANYTT